ncbi:hypothetical protein [Metapseudomonas otitidis]|uniref:hypothetical protein n=1 Tax=Metapseudomonas otitidis TaxID=319939 RepID=UPI00209807BD|nr:hypothetical protein [Pseudomonas otitidis]MCO7555581.1 hypothetical protein [Pseudomonas otitidis]
MTCSSVSSAWVSPVPAVTAGNAGSRSSVCGYRIQAATQQQLQGATHPSQFVADTGQVRQVHADGIQFIEPCIEVIGPEQDAIGAAQRFEVVLQIVQTPKRAAEHGETPELQRSPDTQTPLRRPSPGML